MNICIAVTDFRDAGIGDTCIESACVNGTYARTACIENTYVVGDIKHLEIYS